MFTPSGSSMAEHVWGFTQPSRKQPPIHAASVLVRGFTMSMGLRKALSSISRCFCGHDTRASAYRRARVTLLPSQECAPVPRFSPVVKALGAQRGEKPHGEFVIASIGHLKWVILEAPATPPPIIPPITFFTIGTLITSTRVEARARFSARVRAL
jgi:hypothetical protein